MKQGWERKKIKDICDKATSNIAQNKIVGIDGDFPVYGASGFVQNVNFYHRDSAYIGVVKDGAGVGRVNIYPAYSSLLGTLQYILPKEGYLMEYVAYALKGLNLASHASGATIPHIYFKNYGEIDIPIPPLSIQERIVEELDCISGIIEKKKEQLKELDALAQSIFYTMFGDPVGNDKGWETCPVIEVVKMQRGFDLPVQHRDGKGDIPIYGSNGVIGYHSEYKAKTGIITGRSGTLGEVYVSNEPYWPLNTTLFSVDTHGNNIIYLKYLMKYFHLERFKAGAGVPTLNRNEFHNKPIPLIPLPLQQEFAKKIEAIEKQKELIKASIGEVETLLASRMQEYFE